MQKVIILGSTGSIGRNAIKVIQALGTYQIVGIAAYKQYQLLTDQIQMLKPRHAVLVDSDHYKKLKRSSGKTRLTTGEQGILEMIDRVNADVIICAFASALGIHGILRAIEKKMRICLATKEVLVSFGDIVMRHIKKHKARLFPIDSEHSAVFQCLEGRRPEYVKAIILTASGGPFLKRSLKNVTKKDVLTHPVWKMGRKITVDSATMMNKGLEVIEAHHLFGVKPEKIKVTIHPEALCHSLVEFIDGSIMAQLSMPDMKLPIQYALTAPERHTTSIKYLDINKAGTLHFIPPNIRKFPCLQYAYEALKTGKSMPAVLNAANEESVKLFLQDRLKFNEIPKIIKKVMILHQPRHGSIDDYRNAETWSKETVRSLVC